MRLTGCAALAAGLLVAGGAQAMMAPEVYEEARANAPYHLTVEIVAMAPDEEAIGTCGIEATVVEALRDDSGALAPGDTVYFEVDCLRADAEPNLIPTCVIFHEVDTLVAGARMDVYLEDEWLGYRVVLGQARIIEPTEAAAGAS